MLKGPRGLRARDRRRHVLPASTSSRTRSPGPTGCISGTIKVERKNGRARSSGWSSGTSPSASRARCSRARSARWRSRLRGPRPAQGREERRQGGGLRPRGRCSRRSRSSATSSQASIYAFNLVQKRAKRPAGAPDKALAQKVTKVGVIGAGLMASQFALLFVRRLQVPVVITDLDQARVDKGLAYIHDEIDALPRRAASTPDDSNRLKALVSGTTDKADFARLRLGDRGRLRRARSQAEGVRRSREARLGHGVLATNTSSLSVEQIGARLEHPERRRRLPLLQPGGRDAAARDREDPGDDDATLATAIRDGGQAAQVRRAHRRRPRLRREPSPRQGDGRGCTPVDKGTPVPVVERAFAPIGLPMARSS